MCNAGSSQLFAVAPTFNELLLQSGNLPVEKIICLVDQADEGVRPNRGIRMVEPSRVERVTLMIRQIRRICRIFSKLPRHAPHCHRLGAARRPSKQPPLAQVVLIIEQQLFEARMGDVHEAQLRLRRTGRRATALRNVLAARARGLHHLIHKPRTGVHELFAKPNGRIVNERGRLKTARLPVAAAGSQFFSCELRSTPEPPIQRAILNRLADVAGRDLFAACEIGDRSSHFENPVVGTRA